MSVPSHSSSRRLLAGACAGVVLAITAACGGSSDADEEGTIELTFSTAASEQQATDWQWIAAEVERRTDGRVTFRDFYSGTLVEATETLQAVQDGRADIGWVTPTYQPSDFPVWYVSQLQYLSDNPEAVLRAQHELYDEDSLLTSDFEDSGVHAVGFLVYGPNATGSAKPVDDLSDLDGLILRSGGTSNDIVKAAGAEPENMAVNEVYEGLERGTIDGFIQLPFATVALAGLAEVTPYLTDIGSGPYSAAAFAMNQEVWDGLPSDVQDVFTDVSEDMDTQYFEIQNDLDAAACETYQESGVTVSRLDEADIDTLKQRAVGDLVEGWKQRATDAGEDAAAVDAFFDDYTAAIAGAEPEATTYQNPFEVCS